MNRRCGDNIKKGYYETKCEDVYWRKLTERVEQWRTVLKTEVDMNVRSLLAR